MKQNEKNGTGSSSRQQNDNIVESDSEDEMKEFGKGDVRTFISKLGEKKKNALQASWSCDVCTLINPQKHTRCLACLTPRLKIVGTNNNHDLKESEKEVMEQHDNDEDDDDNDENDPVSIAVKNTFSLARKNAKPVRVETYDRTVGVSWAGIGSGAAIDAGGTWVELEKKKRMEASGTNAASRKKEPAAPQAPAESEVDGLRIPRDLSTVTAVNFVLTQEVGKLKPKDLRKAIDEQRAIREKQRIEQEAIIASGGGETMAQKIISSTLAELAEAAAEDGDGGNKRQLKEMAFLQSLRDIDKEEKDREFQTQRECIGSDLLTEEELAEIAKTREKTATALATMKRASERVRWKSSLYGSYTQPMRRSCSVSLNVSQPKHEPKFDLYNNDLWAMRKRVLQRFVNAANTIIVRSRVSSRLTMIRRRLAEANAVTKEQVRELVELDNRQAAAGASVVASTASRKEVPQSAFADLVVDLEAFPTFLPKSKDSQANKPLSVDLPDDFVHTSGLALKIPDEADLFKYAEEKVPPISMYFDREESRSLSLRTGAHEEDPVRLNVTVESDEMSSLDAQMEANSEKERLAEELRVGGAAPAEDDGEMTPETKENEMMPVGNPEAVPDLAEAARCWIDPLPALPSLLLQADAETRVFLRNDMFTEAQPEFVLRPVHVELNAPKTRRAEMVSGYGGASLGALEGVATISSRYRPPRQRRYASSTTHVDHEGLWSPSNLPKLLERPLQEDAMSDTDSDDEDEEYNEEEPQWPSVELARTLFSSESMSDQSGPRLDLDRAYVELAVDRESDRVTRTRQIPGALDAVEANIVYPKSKMAW